MRQRYFPYFFMLLLLLLCILTSCQRVAPAPKVTILFEDHSSCFFSSQVFSHTAGEDFSISIGVPKGERITELNYDSYSISPKTGSSETYDYYTLTLHKVRYGTVIRFKTKTLAETNYYKDDTLLSTVLEDGPHLYHNSRMFDASFLKEGFQPLGWNTKKDGSGTLIGFGSRFGYEQDGSSLYLSYVKESPASAFSYEMVDGTCRILSFFGTGSVVIPSYIEGAPVTSIAPSAFVNVNGEMLVLPATLQEVSPLSFINCAFQELYFFDTLSLVSDASFENCTFQTVHVNAATPPVYSGSYFDTLSDKLDYLISLKDEKKMILFCGSSARFGYDSPLLESAFPDYKVVNMGVFAYANMLPQVHFLLPFIKEGDVIINSPEFDSIEDQFCRSKRLEPENFAMAESNYDMLTLLDMTEFSGFFDAFSEYNELRSHMASRSYKESPSFYDEDGVLQSKASYNRAGDYVVERPNNIEGIAFGVKRAFYHSSYFTAEDIDGINQVYDLFAKQGAQVLFTYSPRSRISISEDSNEESIKELDALLRTSLHAAFLTKIQDSLMEPLYFFGTDNHLSTEGMEIHTKRVIEAIRPVLFSENP